MTSGPLILSQCRIAPFFASQISRFIHRHFFNKGRIHNAGLYDWLLDDPPPTLIVYVVTALHHALQEWRKNDGAPPAKPSSKVSPEDRSAGGTYFFNLKNDGGRLSFTTLEVVLTSSEASYSTFMTLWNGLPPAMRQKATKSIHNALKAEIKSNEPANDVIPVMDPAPVLELDPDLLAAFLAEPDPEEIDLRPLVIPMATVDSILVNAGPVALLDDLHDEGSSFSEVDDDHLRDGDNGFWNGDNGSEADRDEEAGEPWE